MERMQLEARTVEATGIVGVQISEKTHVWGHHAIEFLAIGTAVTAYRRSKRAIDPQFILNLDT